MKDNLFLNILISDTAVECFSFNFVLGLSTLTVI